MDTLPIKMKHHNSTSTIKNQNFLTSPENFNMLLKSILLASVFLASFGVFAQESVVIGEGMKVVDISTSGNAISVVYQDPALLLEGKPSFYLKTADQSYGPYESLTQESADGISYYEVREKGKNYLLYGNHKFGPYYNTHIVKISESLKKVVVLHYEKNGSYYEILSIAGAKPVSVFKGQRCKEYPLSVEVSDQMDVFMTMDDHSKEAGHAFLWKDVQTKGFLAVHFIGWLRKGTSSEPVFYTIRDIPQGEGMEPITPSDVYIGNKFFARLTAYLDELQFNSDSTDFVLKAFSFTEGPHVYTATENYGPYESVDNVRLLPDNSIYFEYGKEGKKYSWSKTGEHRLLGEDIYIEKHYNADKSEFLSRVTIDEETIAVSYHNRLIAEVPAFRNRTVTWTKNHGPVIIYGKGDMVCLSINGDNSRVYPRVLDFKESSSGELAWMYIDTTGMYVVKGEATYGPYKNAIHLSADPAQFLQWSEDGKELIYAAAGNGSHIYVNGTKTQSFPGLAKFYFHKDLASSAVVVITNPDCFMENDFKSDPLDGSFFDEYYFDDSEEEFMVKKEDLVKIGNCASIYYKGNAFPGFTRVTDLHFSEDGKALSFGNMEEIYLISGDRLMQGQLAGNKAVIYEGDRVITKSTSGL